MNEQNKSILLIGAPTDVGGSMLGASLGPDTLRVSGIKKSIEQLGYEVGDIGNLSGPPNNENARSDLGHKNFEEVYAWNSSVFEAVYSCLDQDDALPIMMGGDHCLAIGSISAVAHYCKKVDKKLVVIWLDAHADINTPKSSPSGNMHGMPVAYLMGLVPEDGWYRKMTMQEHGGIQNVLLDFVQIGLRSLDDAELDYARNCNIDVWSMERLDNAGFYDVCHMIEKQYRSHDIHIHVSFDVDFLDPSYAPGVSTAVPGGPTYREARQLMQYLAGTGLVGSIDVVENNPINDVKNQTGKVTVDLLTRLLGKSSVAE